MKNLEKKHFILIGIWFAINLLQSIFTGLHSDESYYWMYSQNLDWGYFDHPPMAALLIFLGHGIFPGEIGVRIFIILLSTATLAIIINELNEKRDILFLSVFVLSFPLIHTHIAGFLAIPDIPLLFFTVLFIILYRKFTESPNWRTAILLSVVIAAMIYSKYHAFLIVGFTVLSNLKLFKSKYFYGIIAFSLLLLIPHIIWQIENNFPTFTYHLVERAKPLQLKYVFPNLASQLLMAGPLTGIIVFWNLSKFKIQTPFQKALIFNLLGFYIFFFVLSFKNRIEAHWIAATIPMLMLATYPVISKNNKTKIWFERLAIPIIVIMFAYRIYIALDIIPNTGHLKITFYNREASALEIKEKAQGKKVGFFNNYAAASNYIFYTGDSMIHLSTPDYRFCQYDLWDDEKYGEGESLFTVQSKHLNPPELIRIATGEKKGFVTIEKFQSLKGLQIEWKKTIQRENIFEFHFTLHNTTSRPILTNHISEPCLALMQNKTELTKVSFQSSTEAIKILPNRSADITIKIHKNQILKNTPLIFYTRTKENIRGEIISSHLKNILD